MREHLKNFGIILQYTGFGVYLLVAGFLASDTSTGARMYPAGAIAVLASFIAAAITTPGLIGLSIGTAGWGIQKAFDL